MTKTCAWCKQPVIIEENAPGRHKLAVYDADSGRPHICKHDPVPDWCECICGAQVYRYTDGRRTNLDGTEHRHTTTPLPAPSAPAPRPPMKPMTKHGIDTTVIVKD